jgi:sec-independent protein translocase protein TatA
MGRGLFEGWHLIILVVLVIVLFGFRRLPDAARSIGRSMRIFKSEVEEMKNDGKDAPSKASRDTVKGETVKDADPSTPAEGTSAMREDRSPRTDNTTGAA